MNDPQRPVDYYRFCPGEERVRISDAICRGRRKAHFPKCRGCRFNDDERTEPATRLHPTDTGSTTFSLDSMFHLDDVSAAAPFPLSSEIAWRVGHATAQYLRGKLRGLERAEPTARSVVLGRDSRPLSQTILAALADGILGYGVDVIDIGIVDTPQLHWAVNRLGASGGVQVTGGHLPWDHTGFRFCGPKGAPISVDTGLTSIRDITTRVPKHKTGLGATRTESDLSAPYRDFVRGLLVAESGKLPRPIRVVADAGNGVAGRLLPLLFNGIKNLTVVPLNDRSDGEPAHDPDPLAPKSTRQLRAAIKQHKAALGVCFDTDLSRCAFLDEKGSIIASDVLATLLARRMVERQAQAVIVFDLRCSAALAEETERLGGSPIPSKTGRLSIRRTMMEHGALFGADIAGGFYFRDSLFCESALLALVQTINVLAVADRKLSELIRPLQRYRSSGEIIVPSTDPEGVCRTVVNSYKDAIIDNLDGITVRYPDWWFNLRHEPDEPALHLVLQARTRKAVEQKLSEVQTAISTGP